MMSHATLSNVENHQYFWRNKYRRVIKCYLRIVYKSANAKILCGRNAQMKSKY